MSNWKKKIAVFVVLVALSCVVFVGAFTRWFATRSETLTISRKEAFLMDFSSTFSGSEAGPGDEVAVEPKILSDATLPMYVFMKVTMPFIEEEPLYDYDVNSEWIEVEIDGNSIIYAYGSHDQLTVLAPGDETTPLTEKVVMKSVTNAQYAYIEDLDISFVAYAIGTDDVPTVPSDAWTQLKEAFLF